MRIAVSIESGALAPHFGHAPGFAFYDVDYSSKAILSVSQEPAPEHQPGLLPRWLRDRNVDAVIAARMGNNARLLLKKFNIEIVAGAPALPLEDLIGQYLHGTLEITEMPCGH